MSTILAWRQFQMYFLELKWKNSDSIFTEICSQESNLQKASIGSGNGFAPNRRQAITWTNADAVHWQIYAGRWVKNDDNTIFPKCVENFSNEIQRNDSI